MEFISINIVFDTEEIITENDNLKTVLNQFDRNTLKDMTAVKWCCSINNMNYECELPIPIWLSENTQILTKAECIRNFIAYCEISLLLGLRYKPAEE